MLPAQAQLDYVNNVPNAATTYKDSLAEAKLTLTDSQADADLAWIDGETQSENDTIALDESGRLTAGARADQIQGNSDASADVNFQIAQASETATIWAGIVGWTSPTAANPNGLPGLPWIETQAGLAHSRL